MSISILNRGGASGGLKPELIVTAPAGSIIDLLQSGVIVATYTLGSTETKHTFIVKVGTYMVRGTLGEYTKSYDVLIDTVGQYSVKLAYQLWLYNQGNEYSAVTGGWVGYRGYLNQGKYSKGGTTLGVYSGVNNGTYQGNFIAARKIDVTAYSTLYAHYTSRVASRVSLSTSTTDITYEEPPPESYDSTTQMFTVDLSAYSGSYAIFFAAIGTTGWSYVDKIWLE